MFAMLSHSLVVHHCNGHLKTVTADTRNEYLK